MKRNIIIAILLVAVMVMSLWIGNTREALSQEKQKNANLSEMLAESEAKITVFNKNSVNYKQYLMMQLRKPLTVIVNTSESKLIFKADYKTWKIGDEDNKIVMFAESVEEYEYVDCLE